MTMGQRAFPFETTTQEGRPYTAMRIECAQCEVKAFFVQNGNVRKPPEAAVQYFRNHGWRVGNGPRADICPNCQPKRKPDLKVVPVEQAKAEAPREMTREERRIITTKLDDIYLEGKYQAPWTDAAVSRDLGIPRAWVAEVRDQFFGPGGSNPDFDEFLEKAAPIIAELKNLHRSVMVQLEEARGIAGRVEELERLSRRIERELGR